MGDHLRLIPILLLLAGSCCGEVENVLFETLHDESVLQLPAAVHTETEDIHIQQFSIAPHSTVMLNITTVSSSASFIIVQVHAHLYNVSLSYGKNPVHLERNRTMSGSNIGFFIKPVFTITTLHLQNDNNVTVQLIAAAIAYDNKAPVPGGCNMEFDDEIAPYSKVRLQDSMVIVDMQPASMSLENRTNCDKNLVEHKMYQMYLTERDFSAESYFYGIISMLTVADIQANGYEVPQQSIVSPMRRYYGSYIGTGSVYASIATYDKKSAAYIPTFSYGCDPVQDPQSCEIFPDTFSKVVSVFCFLLGIVLMFPLLSAIAGQVIGHLFVGTMVGYMIVGSIGYGLLIGFLSMILAYIPLSGSLSVAWFISCLIFNSIPDILSILHIYWVFLILFASTTILFAILASCLTVLIIYLNSLIYIPLMIVLPLDYWFGSSLKYILLNIARKLTIPNFNYAIILQPISGTDIFLICIWVILALLNIIFTSLYGC